MKSYRKELWFHVPERRAFINITSDRPLSGTARSKKGFALSMPCTSQA